MGRSPALFINFSFLFYFFNVLVGENHYVFSNCRKKSRFLKKLWRLFSFCMVKNLDIDMNFKRGKDHVPYIRPSPVPSPLCTRSGRKFLSHLLRGPRVLGIMGFSAIPRLSRFKKLGNWDIHLYRPEITWHQIKWNSKIIFPN